MGDLDEDGDLDIVFASIGAGYGYGYGSGSQSSISVLLGNVDGSFGIKTDYAVGNTPISVALGDINSDGRQDIVTANRNNNTVSVLLGNGDGTFGIKTDYAVGSNPSSVALGDVNGDGVIDLAIANDGDDNISVLLNDGNGIFDNGINYQPGIGDYQFVILSDVNSDNRLDLVTSGFILLGNGDGTFGTTTTYRVRSLSDLALVDVNGDGNVDLLSSGDNTVSVVLGDGFGNFASDERLVFEVGNGATSIAVDDFDIDRANKLKVSKNTNEWDISDFLLWQSRLKNINDFKNQWVCNYKNVIHAASDEFNIPPNLLAAIAWREVGGDPHFLDTVAYEYRSLFVDSLSANKTSFGDLSLQVRRVALDLGYDPDKLSNGEAFRMIESLQDPKQNIFLAAQHLGYLRDIYRPGKKPSDLSEKDLLALAGAYNRGPVYRRLEDFWKYPSTTRNYAGGYGISAFNGLKQCGCF